jgi:MarR family transcriptional regulator, organic hydroperoxide resistance regulator
MPPRNRTPAPRAENDGPNLKPLFNDLVRLETELWDAVEDRLRAEHGITLPFFEFMQVIARTPGCRVHDIAAELGITVGGTSKIVDRIEAAGYCARQANPNDRRSSIVTLTAAGKRLLPRVTATVDSELNERLGQKLTERSLAELAKTLTRLRSGMRGPEAAGKTAS